MSINGFHATDRFPTVSEQRDEMFVSLGSARSAIYRAERELKTRKAVVAIAESLRRLHTADATALRLDMTVADLLAMLPAE